MTSPTADPVSLVTSRDPVGRHLGGVLDHEIDDARLSLEEMRRVNDATPEFKAWVAEFIARKRVREDYANEEVPSSYDYPSGFAVRPIRQQLKSLAAHFPGLSLTGAMEYSKKMPPVPTRYTIPKIEVVARLICPGEKDPAVQYCRAVEYVLAKLAASRSFTNWRAGEIDKAHLRQHRRTVEMLAKLAEGQPGDILIIPGGQLGIRHRGKSVRRVRSIFEPNEFGFGAFAVGCILLTHPRRLGTGDELWIDCPGDEWAVGADGRFDRAPMFFFDQKLQFDVEGNGRAIDNCGSASGFLPTGQAGVLQSDRAS